MLRMMHARARFFSSAAELTSVTLSARYGLAFSRLQRSQPKGLVGLLNINVCHCQIGSFQNLVYLNAVFVMLIIGILESNLVINNRLIGHF